jgi:hypothetical protein
MKTNLYLKTNLYGSFIYTSKTHNKPFYIPVKRQWILSTLNLIYNYILKTAQFPSYYLVKQYI